MRKLIAITTLGLAFGFSSISFAFDSYNAFGVQVPVVRSEVKNEIRGGKVETDFTSFYTSPKTANTTTSSISSQRSDDQYVYVFGVRIAR
jgi:hypothetical protein